MGQKVWARGQCLDPLSVWPAPWAGALWVSSLESQELIVGLSKQTNNINKTELKEVMLVFTHPREWLNADF